MNNWKQPGDTVTLTAPAGGVTTGLGVKIGQLFVVATATVAAGLPFEGRVTGVVELVKDAGTAWTEGELLFWDDVDDNVTPSPTGNLLIGAAVDDVDAGDVLGEVRLNATARNDGAGVAGAGSNLIKGERLGAPDLLTDNRFLLSTVMLATPYVLDETTLPADNPPRNVIVTHATDTTTDTLGNVVIDGTNVDDQVIQETLAVAADGVVTGAKAFKTVTAVQTAGWVQGGGVSDTIEVGFGELLGLAEVRADATEVFLGTLDGLMRDFDAIAIDAANVEGNTVSLTGGTYDSAKVAKVLIQL